MSNTQDATEQLINKITKSKCLMIDVTTEMLDITAAYLDIYPEDLARHGAMLAHAGQSEMMVAILDQMQSRLEDGKNEQD